MTCPTPAQREAVRQRPAGFSVGHQRWNDLLFAHWEVAPAQVQATLPVGLHCDTHEGRAYVGIVPFFMERIRPALLPPLPWVSWFLELNVRTYVHDDQGRPGVWFYSLDCNQPIAVQMARRFFRLPYFHARMTARRNGDVLDYQCQRHGSREARYRWTAASETQTAAPGSLEFFLLERYALFTAGGGGGIHTGRVHHEPYRYGATEAKALSTEPATLAGFDLKGEPCSLLAAKQVDVEIFALQKVPT
ncbi:MAG: YqjF family protein [Limisphaerales bacterium]